METFIMVSGSAVVIFLFISGVFFQERENFWGLLFLILGMGFLIVFGRSLEKNTEGYPLTKISGGTYDVISVYDARDRVSLWIEKAENNKKKHLFFYQFPREAFVGGISEGAKYLVVTETDGFKRLQLQ